MNGLIDLGILPGQVLLGQGFEAARKGLNKGFRGRPVDFSDIVTGVLVFLGIALAVWVLSYVLSLRERRRGRTSPLGLFLSLCKAHRLRWAEQWLLWRVARAQKLRDPARLFLEPERFRPAGLGAALQSRSAELENLRDRLFAEPSEPDIPRDQSGGSVKPKRAEAPQTGSPLPPPVSPTTLDVPPWPPTPMVDPNLPSATYGGQ